MTERATLIADLRVLLSHDRLGGWGMETLIDTLHQLLPELREPYSPLSPTFLDTGI
jgi:hypothetical protein